MSLGILHLMNDTARSYQTPDAATTDGMDDLFETVAQPLRDPSVTPSHGLTFKEACDYYKLKPTALRTRIKAGEIAAEKIEGLNGPEWRVYTETVTQPLRDPFVTVAQPLREVPDNRLLDLVEDLQSKLEKANRELQAAHYRVGYLENQVSERERDIQELDGTVKLLTDSQHQSKWWSRFSSWFKPSS